MNDITELFQKDPLSLTREDRTKIVDHYRTTRAQYLAAGKVTKTAKSKPVKQSVDLGNIELEL